MTGGVSPARRFGKGKAAVCAVLAAPVSLLCDPFPYLYVRGMDLAASSKTASCLIL